MPLFFDQGNAEATWRKKWKYRNRRRSSTIWDILLYQELIYYICVCDVEWSDAIGPSQNLVPARDTFVPILPS